MRRRRSGRGRRRGRRFAPPTPLVFALATVVVGFGVVMSVNPQAKSAAAPPAAVAAAHPQGPAPDFHLASVTSKGSVDLAVAVGRPVVLSFFASWCDSCRQELGTIASLARAGGTTVQVIGIDVNDDSATARKLLRSNHVTYPVGADGNDAVASSYRLVGLPTTVFLDAQHRIVGRVVGPLTVPVGRAWLAALQKPAA